MKVLLIIQTPVNDVSIGPAPLEVKQGKTGKFYLIQQARFLRVCRELLWGFSASSTSFLKQSHKGYLPSPFYLAHVWDSVLCLKLFEQALKISSFSV